MADKNLYIPLNELIKGPGAEWTFISLNITYEEIAKNGIVLWCLENILGKWTMLGGSKFGFESGPDALAFKIQFGGFSNGS